MTAMRVPVPRLYLGTMTFGWMGQTSSTVDEPMAMEMLKLFVQHNEAADLEVHHVDTARIYASGRTEPIVGAILKSFTPSKGAIVLGTKAHPSVEGGLSSAGIRGQVQASLEAMDVKSFGEYYLHQPDTEHSLLESLKCAHDLVTEGVVCTIGMSNYHSSEMERAFQICETHNLTRPTVYQGLYNPLNRAVEEELLPVLKKNKCSFVAYNPLAAGMLAGKHTNKDEVQAGRFKNNPNYLPRFYTDSNFEAIDLIRKACEKEGITMVEATYRWLLRHSALDENDGVLLGASSAAQLTQNLHACAAATEKGPLSPQVLEAFDEAWKITADGAFPYWRSYSSDMPNRDSLDQGASYDAAKVKKT
jgi:aflatoxin B1 aldehyde reductase